MKNKILKAITTINAVSLIFFACCLNSDSWVPLIICLVNALWLVLFVFANVRCFYGE